MERELKLARRLAVFLVKVAVTGKVLKWFYINVISRMVKYFLQSLNWWVAETLV